MRGERAREARARGGGKRVWRAKVSYYFPRSNDATKSRRLRLLQRKREGGVCVASEDEERSIDS